MRKSGVILTELVAQKEKGFLRFALARDQTERPIVDFLAAGKPFVGPGEENGPGQSAFDHAVDVPAEHLGLLVLAVADRVHPELAENERTILGEILETQEVTLERVLIVQVNVEAGEIAVLREEKFRGRIAGIRKENVRIRVAADPDQVFDEFGHAADAEPPNHRARDLVADEITEDGGVTAIGGDG